MLTNLRIMPRWFIFCLDLIVVSFAISLAYGLRFNFDAGTINHIDIRMALAIVLLANMVAFVAFRNHIGIVRYTAMSDTLRLLQLCFVTNTFFWATGQVLSTSYYLLFPASVVAINFFLSFSLLFGYRLLVRVALQKNHFLRSKIKTTKKAVIYGSSQEAILAGQVFSNSPQPAFRVVAFVDADRAKMRIVGLPVVAPEEKNLKGLVEQGVECILVPDYESGGKDLSDFVDMAFRCGIHDVRKLPPMKQWMDGKLEADQLKEVRIEDLLERAPILIENKKVLDSIKGKRVLVTGAAGSIGSELVRQLIQLKPSTIVLIDVAESPLHELLLELRENKVSDCSIYPMIGDITNRSRMEYIFDVYHPELVFHAAAYKHVPLMEENPSIAVLNNVVGTRNLVELSVDANVETFVLVSTDKAVNPTNVMGASKRIAEIYMQSLSHALAKLGKEKPRTKFITTRFGNVLGSNGSVIPRFKQQIAAGGPVTVTHPDINRFFMTIAEACQLVIEASVMGEGGEIFIFDMGKAVKIADLAEKMIRLSGKVPGRDIKIAFTGLRPGEKLYEEMLAKTEETLPTYHKKIKIARVRTYDLDIVVEMIDELVVSARMHYVMETVQGMKKLVPEFLSKNSPFERLDAAIESPDSIELPATPSTADTHKMAASQPLQVPAKAHTGFKKSEENSLLTAGHPDAYGRQSQAEHLQTVSLSSPVSGNGSAPRPKPAFNTEPLEDVTAAFPAERSGQPEKLQSEEAFAPAFHLEPSVFAEPEEVQVPTVPTAQEISDQQECEIAAVSKDSDQMSLEPLPFLEEVESQAPTLDLEPTPFIEEPEMTSSFSLEPAAFAEAPTTPLSIAQVVPEPITAEYPADQAMASDISQDESLFVKEAPLPEMNALDESQRVKHPAVNLEQIAFEDTTYPSELSDLFATVEKIETEEEKDPVEKPSIAGSYSSPFSGAPIPENQPEKRPLATFAPKPKPASVATPAEPVYEKRSRGWGTAR